MQLILRCLTWEAVIVYLINVSDWTDFDDALLALRQVFIRFNENGLKLTPS